MWNRSLLITLIVGAAAPAIAQTSSSQYLVYVAAAEPTTELSKVRTIAPDAFVSQLSSGQRVIQVGRFNNLNLAQRRVQELSQSGFQADVQPVAPRLAPAPLVSTPIATLPPPTTTGVPIPIERLPNVPAPTGTFGSPVLPPTSAAIEINRPTAAVPLPPTQAVAVPTPPSLPSSEEGRYAVIVPTNNTSMLQRVRTVAPSAEIRGSSRGPYIEVRRYTERGSAEALSSTLRQQGFDARVTYF